MRRTALLAALTVLLSAASVPVASADLDGELARVENRMAEFRAQVDAASGERTQLADELLATGERLDELSVQLSEAQQRLEQIDEEAAATQRVINSLQATIDGRNAHMDDLRLRLDRVRGDALERAVELYMAPWPGEGSDPEVGLDAGAPVAMVYAERVQRIADRDIMTLEALRAEERRTLARLEEERAVLKDRLAELQDTRALREVAAERVEDRRGVVEEELGRQQALLAQLDAQIEEIDFEIAGLAAEEDRIRALIAAEAARGGEQPGILARPVTPGWVSSGYGYRIHPIYGETRLHTGLDMDAYCGQPIVAAGGGRVFLADWKGGYGIAVMIDHGGGMSTLYGHLSGAAVGYGQWVETGQVIGYGGTTGVSTGCHLHFEVRINGSPVDPAPYL